MSEKDPLDLSDLPPATPATAIESLMRTAGRDTTTLRAIDLCSGAGGWACAARGLPIHIELAVDFWPVACRTYQLNHPETRVLCADLRSAAIQEERICSAGEAGA